MLISDLGKSTAGLAQQKQFYQKKITWQLTCIPAALLVVKGSLLHMKLSQHVKNVRLLV